MSRFSIYSSGLFLSLTKVDVEFPNLFLLIQNLSTGSLNPTKNWVLLPIKALLIKQYWVSVVHTTLTCLMIYCHYPMRDSCHRKELVNPKWVLGWEALFFFKSNTLKKQLLVMENYPVFLIIRIPDPIRIRILIIRIRSGS